MNNRTGCVTAIILAAGSGSRMQAKITKQRMKICGESVLRHTLRAFSDCELIDSVVVVCKEDEITEIKADIASDFPKVYRVIPGGKFRAESAKIGFSAIPANTEYVAIHDAVRCLITSEMITSVVKSAFLYGAATAACKLAATLKSVDGDGFISKTIPRDSLYIAQTPQVFLREKYAEALRSVEISENVTDDNMLIESLGGKVFCVDTGEENIKITTRSDLKYADYIIKRRMRGE